MTGSYIKKEIYGVVCVQCLHCNLTEVMICGVVIRGGALIEIDEKKPNVNGCGWNQE